MEQSTTTDTLPPSLAKALVALRERFRELVAAGLRSPATLAMHDEHAGWLLAYFGDKHPLAEIDEAALEAWAQDERAGRRMREVSNGTLRKRAATLRLALKLARRRNWISRVPEFPELAHRYRPRRWHLRSADEYNALVAELPLERAEWVALATFSGQHPADVDRMRYGVDADPFGRTPWMLIRNTKNRRTEGQLVVMPTPLARVLRRRVERVGLRWGEPLVQAWSKDARCKQLRDAGVRAGIRDRVTATALRHTCGTWAAAKLRTLTVGLKDWMGHSSFEMLSRVYAHALPPALREVAAALGAMARETRRPPKGSARRHRAGGKGSRKENGPAGVPPPTGPEPSRRHVHRGSEGADCTRSGRG